MEVTQNLLECLKAQKLRDGGYYFIVLNISSMLVFLKTVSKKFPLENRYYFSFFIPALQVWCHGVSLWYSYPQFAYSPFHWEVSGWCVDLRCLRDSISRLDWYGLIGTYWRWYRVRLLLLLVYIRILMSSWIHLGYSGDTVLIMN